MVMVHKQKKQQKRKDPKKKIRKIQIGTIGSVLIFSIISGLYETLNTYFARDLSLSFLFLRQTRGACWTLLTADTHHQPHALIGFS